MRKVTYYTDGSCNNHLPSPCSGGWAYVSHYEAKILSVNSAGCYDTTNNRMELKAVIEALRDFLNSGYSKCVVFSDSKYCVNAAKDGGFNIYLWKLANWESQMGGQIKNTDLMTDLYEMLVDIKNAGKVADIKWVKGHSNNKFNDYADRLCNKERLKELERRNYSRPRQLSVFHEKFSAI